MIIHCRGRRLYTETEQRPAVVPGPLSEGGGEQPCKPPIDLCLAALGGPMPSIIDLGAIIKHPV